MLWYLMQLFPFTYWTTYEEELPHCFVCGEVALEAGFTKDHSFGF